MPNQEKPKVDKAAVDKAFETLKTYDYGMDCNLLNAIDDAIAVTSGDASARRELETRLAAVLKTDASRSAKDFVCRKLTVIGTAKSVPALAALLPDKDLSHMARYALERMPAPEAAQAMRESVEQLEGKLQVGVIGSLGVRRDKASVAVLAPVLGSDDKMVACAAACALGDIGTPDAVKALGKAGTKAPEEVKAAVADATLACAERLLADGKKTQAAAVYRSLAGSNQSKLVRLAATQGMLNVAGKKK